MPSKVTKKATKKATRNKSGGKSAGRTDRPILSDGDDDLASNGQFGNRVHLVMGKTINLGNYESMRVEYGECRTVDDGQDFDEVREAVEESVCGRINAMVEMVEQEAAKR